MPLFQYHGRNAQGNAVSGDIEAASASAVATQLFNTAITPISIEEIQRSAGLDDLLYQWQRRKKPELDDLILFARQFYTLMRAGVPIIRSINGLADTTRNLMLKEALHEVLGELEAGHELSAAMTRHPKVFSSLFINMVRVGENSGRLDEVFLQLASYLEREKTTRDQVKAAMRYPSFVIIAVAAAMFVINLWVIPTFAKVFSGFHAQLPLPTRILLMVSDFTVAYWMYILGALFLSTLALRHYLNTREGRYRWDKVKLRIPIIGNILLRATLSRFARTFAMSIRSGVPLVQALVLVSHAVDNAFIGKAVEDMRNGIERGDTLTRTAAASNMFTPLVLQMMAVGEETGAVDDLLEQVSDFYDREVDYDLKSLTSKLEPILIIIIAAMVLVLALGVFLPTWDLINVAK
ncbi:MAG TPA: type II secretion system F family protein [Gammaproteobacteria bacterium]|nr:type II secretion system F family protein [Gammaproteobacteria bacterium]